MVNEVTYAPRLLRDDGSVPLTAVGATRVTAQLDVFGASGSLHAKGLVPDPGASSGTTKFLREDGTWQDPGGAGSFQPLDATLTAIAGVATASDTIVYFTGVDVAASTPLTGAGRNLIGDADASAQRTTLGLGALAVLSTVGTSQITDSAVTYAKIQNSSAGLTVLGRSANSAGVFAQIAATAASGQVLRESGSVLGFGQVATPGIADAAVTYAKIQSSSVGLAVLARSANTSGVFAELAASAASGAVLRESGSAIAWGTVATAGIANAAVTYAKIQNVSATDKILGRSSAGAGTIEEISCTSFGRGLLAAGITPVDGGMLYYNGGWKILAPDAGPGAIMTLDGDSLPSWVGAG